MAFSPALDDESFEDEHIPLLLLLELEQLKRISELD
ncbi:uncharacterized protein G2W53_014547 [Senna tora]|uniref:Uncharacterized protein n=1 Tax=Senna tora TaxID=362788 RepID=A0A835C4B0_9FABA|nr:uncharacterized protein G2W53_014547 [Senna tora]